MVKPLYGFELSHFSDVLIENHCDMLGFLLNGCKKMSRERGEKVALHITGCVSEWVLHGLEVSVCCLMAPAPALTDVNECWRYPGRLCAQTCENTPGSYHCSCTAGFSLAFDGKNCEGKLDFFFFFFSQTYCELKCHLFRWSVLFSLKNWRWGGEPLGGALASKAKCSLFTDLGDSMHW